MDLQELFRSLVEQAGAKTVYRDPISCEGRTVVPVARVRCGFGGGSGKKGTQQQKGGGGGGGFVAQPVGFIELSSEGTRFVPITNSRDRALAMCLGVFLGFLVSRLVPSRD
jgi:uncharacterized spore protein YtfJ